MTHTSLKTLIVVAVCALLSAAACKSKNSNVNTTDTAATYMEPRQDNSTVKPDTMPVQISADDSLTRMAKDAVKDYPGVTATVSNGEVTLTGNITRDKLPKLMQAVNAMHPKKVNNNLTIK